MALIQVRRDTAAAWTSANTTLATGEIGFETDTGKFKVGNGTAWNSLGYFGLGANTFTGTQAFGGNLATQPKLQAYRETVTTPAISTGTLTLDLSGSNNFNVSLNANITTLTISNVPTTGTGAVFVLRFTADGTARSVTWPASITWVAGTAPTLTSTNNKRDTFIFESFDGGTTWAGYVGGQGY